VYIGEFLEPQSVSCNLQTTLKEATKIFSKQIVDKIPVVESTGEVKGIFTVEGLAKSLFEKVPLEAEIKDCIEKAVVVKEKALIADVLEHPLNKIVVVDEENCFLGVISLNKLVATLLKQRDNASCNLNAILDTSSNCIISIDSKRAITFLNESAAKLLQVEKEAALGKNIEMYIPHSRLPEIVRTGKAEIGYRFKFRGKTFITNRNPVCNKGKVEGAIAVFQDITELQDIMEELTNVKEYQNILETVVDNDYDCIVVVDANGIVTMFNKAYEEFLKIPREKAVGKHVTEVIENTRMHIVIKTGKAEIGDIQKIHGHDMVAMRFPIKKDGKIWGAVGKVMFKDVKELKALVEKVSNLQTELEYYKDVVKKIQGSHYTFDNIIGSSPEMQEIKAMAQRVARNNSTVLIRGESGTGKELFAHAIHNVSYRKYGPFIKVNCSAIPETLLESELFGYEEGAFTGAKKGGKLGKFEMADKGTIFLDEIGDTPLNMQVKLLRVLQEREIERVGGTKSIPIDVRVIAATNRSLEELIKAEKFRMDLYYRLNVVELKIPPLRYRKEDISELIDSLLEKQAFRMGCRVPGIDPEALNVMLSYHWPGNIRELENVLERCLNFVEKGVIKAKHLPYHIRRHELRGNGQIIPLKDLIEETEREAINKALEICGGNKLNAAQMLGISRAGIYQKIEKLEIN